MAHNNNNPSADIIYLRVFWKTAINRMTLHAINARMPITWQAEGEGIGKGVVLGYLDDNGINKVVQF